jgi:Protein of unknown function (DUF642)
MMSLRQGFWRWGLAALVTACALLGTCGSAAAENLITDGGFETPEVPERSFTSFGLSQTFADWTVVGASGYVSPISGKYTSGGFTFPAHSGKQWLDLTGAASNRATGVAQTVATTPESTYTLGFWVGNVYEPGEWGTTSTVNVLVNGTHVFSATNSMQPAEHTQVWEHFTVSVKATSGTTMLAFINGDPSNDNSNGLDEITFERPEAISPAAAFSLPPAKQCVSKRHFTVHVRRYPGVTWIGAVIKINGRRIKTIGRSHITAYVNLVGLPKGTFVLSITATASNGQKVTGTRTYHTCVPKSKRHYGPGKL